MCLFASTKHQYKSHHSLAMSRSALVLACAVLCSTAASSRQLRWEPENCEELEPGVPCRKLYEHPQGSQLVTPCPVESWKDADGCGAQFAGKADGEKCPQITCPKALGKTMKLICGGGCCPTCWAPDHVVNLDRHTSVNDAAVVDTHPAAPPTCKGAKCFQLACAEGYTEGHVQGNCCYSCVPGR